MPLGLGSIAGWVLISVHTIHARDRIPCLSDVCETCRKAALYSDTAGKDDVDIGASAVGIVNGVCVFTIAKEVFVGPVRLPMGIEHALATGRKQHDASRKGGDLSRAMEKIGGCHQEELVVKVYEAVGDRTWMASKERCMPCSLQNWSMILMTLNKAPIFSELYS
jgi:hypothetical protein